MVIAETFKQMQIVRVRENGIDENFSINDEELQLFTESCRDLYEAGVPINELLRQLQQSTPNKKLALAINLMIDDIENGKLLSDAMARFPKAFGEDYRSMIQAAEKSGRWTRRRDRNGEMRGGILEMLIKYISRRNSTRERIKSGLAYPAIIAVAIIAALGAFAFYVLPALRQIFQQIGGESNVGLLTRMIFSLSSFVEHYWWATPIALVLAAFGCRHYWVHGSGKELWMKYQLRLKVIGPVFVKMNLGETMWLMGTLFSAGLTPQETLSIVMESTRNREIAGAVAKAKEYLFQGIGFCDALKKAHSIFDGHAYMVVASAQKNGRLGEALQNYAEQLFEKSDQEIDRMVKLIEPIMLILAGIIVGLIVISYYSGLSAAIGNLASR